MEGRLRLTFHAPVNEAAWNLKFPPDRTLVLNLNQPVLSNRLKKIFSEKSALP